MVVIYVNGGFRITSSSRICFSYLELRHNTRHRYDWLALTTIKQFADLVDEVVIVTVCIFHGNIGR